MLNAHLLAKENMSFQDFKTQVANMFTKLEGKFDVPSTDTLCSLNCCRLFQVFTYFCSFTGFSFTIGFSEGSFEIFYFYPLLVFHLLLFCTSSLLLSDRFSFSVFSFFFLSAFSLLSGFFQLYLLICFFGHCFLVEHPY